MLLPVIFFASLFFSACTLISPKISKTPNYRRTSAEAAETVSILKRQNYNLTTFKGLGKITFLGREGKNVATRIAWVASVPDRIRITLSSISGQPIVSVASDGQWLYLISYAKGDFYKKRATTSNMKRFFSISIRSRDIVDLLAGRVPLEKYDSAVLMADGSLNSSSDEGFTATGASSTTDNEHGDILILKDIWGNVLEKIYLNRNHDARTIEMFNTTGTLLYRVQFYKMQQIEAYSVPSRLEVSNDEGQGFTLDLNRYWADARVSPSVFTLTPPK
jgi:outer membrane lipoprotein-sorting protein